MVFINEKFWAVVNRRKRIHGDVMATSLRRCLTTTDLALLGVGHMVGAGIYVVTGTIALSLAGPATFLSFLISGLAALLSALCFVEFGSQVPKAGTSYTYSYLKMGEIWAFVAGWNMILESGLGVASISRSFSGTVDALSGGRVVEWMEKHAGHINLGPSDGPPDLIAFAVVMTIAIFISFGAKCSAKLNNALTALSICTITVLVITGFSQANRSNWTNVPGGFFPHGASGVFQGAAMSFFSYLGFDAITMGSEEAVTPRRSVPIATFTATAVAMTVYFLASSSLTLLVPYNHINPLAPFSNAFAERGLLWASYLVSFGSFCAMVTSLLANMFALPRSIYAMADDGLLFRCLSYVHPVTQTPLVAILSFGLFVATIALVTSMEVLVQMTSIGSLMAYTFVSISLLVLRFEPLGLTGSHPVSEEERVNLGSDQNAPAAVEDTAVMTQPSATCGLLRKELRYITWWKGKIPDRASTWMVANHALGIVLFDCVAVFLLDEILNSTWWAILLLIITGSAVVLLTALLMSYETDQNVETFQIPWTPLVPSLSIAINVLLMLQMSGWTWAKFVVWIAIGLSIYAFYGAWHSKENRPLASSAPE